MSQLIETLNGLADGWSAFALALLIQSSLVTTVLLTLEWALRRHVRAAIRYGLLLLVLVKLVLPPGLALPTGAAYWLPTPSDAGSDPAGQRTMAVTVREVEGSLIPIERADQAEPTTGRSALTLPTVVVGVWGWVALVLCVVLARRSLQIRRIVAASTEPPGELRSWFEQYRKLAACGQHVRLRVSDQLPSPALCGLWRPTILIPRTLAERLAESDLQAILVHELQHVERHDLWINHLQTVLQIVYWWHPLLWLANARIRQVREEAVDDAVMVALADRAERYPATLIEVAKAVMNRPFTRLGFLGIYLSIASSWIFCREPRRAWCRSPGWRYAVGWRGRFR